MATATIKKPAGPMFCGFCAYGNHRLCPGGCACADDREHRPSATLAARMFRYACPDLADLDEMERARRWREEVNG